MALRICNFCFFRPERAICDLHREVEGEKCQRPVIRNTGHRWVEKSASASKVQASWRNDSGFGKNKARRGAAPRPIFLAIDEISARIVRQICRPARWPDPRNRPLFCAKKERDGQPKRRQAGRKWEGKEKNSKSSAARSAKTLRAAGCRRSIMKIPVYLLLRVDPATER